jgi:hypothetical protein
MSIILFSPRSGYMTWLCLCVSNVGRIHSLLLITIKRYPWGFSMDFAFASTKTRVRVLSFMYPSFSFWLIEWGCFWARTEVHILHQRWTSSPYFRIGAKVPCLRRDSSTEGEATWRTKSSPWANYSAISSSELMISFIVFQTSTPLVILGWDFF